MSCTVRNATILRYSSENFESLQAGKTGNIKFKKQNVIFLDKSSNSIDTLSYQSLWGYIKNDDTLRVYKNNYPWKFESGKISCVALYYRKIGRYPSGIGKRYFFSTHIDMKPVEAENDNVIKLLFNNDKASFKEFKKQNRLKGSYNVDVIKKYIELHNCAF
jgi:hypothetical protein